MTHIENVLHILNYGITHKNSANSNPNFVTIGDISLIDTRSTRQVRVDNGDFLNFDCPTITLGDFIPFYFGTKMPMLYVMQNGGNFVQKATSPEDIIYLVCSVESIANAKENYFFSDGHAIDNLTTFYDKSKITDLADIIDWSSIRHSYWSGQENLNIKRKKQAEFLISGDLSAEHIVGFGCYNEAAKKKLLEMEITDEKIKIIPNSYY